MLSLSLNLNPSHTLKSVPKWGIFLSALRAVNRGLPRNLQSVRGWYSFLFVFPKECP